MAFPDRGVQPTQQRSRYPAIDVLRGLALVSMVSSHVTHYQPITAIGRTFHKGLWIDGAFVFVALSGVVVGLVHRRIVDRSGLRPSVRKLVRRAAFIYVVHLALTLLAIVAAWIDRDDLIVGVPEWGGVADVPRVVARVLLLRLEPEDNGVLPIYVVFLLLAVPAVWLLARGRWRAVLGGSLVIYWVGWVVGGVSFVPGEFQLPTWQALFIGGLLLGWTWEHERRRLPIEWRRRIVLVASAAAAAFLALALVAPGHGGRFFGRLVEKMAGGPVAFLYAAVAMVAGYVIVERALRQPWMATLAAPIRTLGSKGLPGYAAMQVTVMGLDLLPNIPRTDLVVIGVVVICGFTEYAAVKLQQRRRRRTEPADAGVTADVAGEEPAGPPPASSGLDGPARPGGRDESVAYAVAARRSR